MIPGANDADPVLHAMSEWMVTRLGPDVPWHFSAFHPDYKMLDRPRTPAATLTRAREIARGHGMRHVYTGNVHDPGGQSSYCHGCGAVVIERDGYELGAWRLDAAGCCKRCGTRLPGVFDGPPGRWGARRLPVRLAEFTT